MKTIRLLMLIICILLLTNLACIVTDIQDKYFPMFTLNEGAVKINEIDITPQEGTLHFHANVMGPSHTSGDTLVCSVIADSGDVEEFNHAVGPQTGGTGKQLIASFDYDYSVPGTHSLVCTTQTSKSSWSADFTVVSGPASIPPQASPGNTQSTTAGLALLVEKATSSIPGLFPTVCVPEVNIAADGTLTGSCSVTMYGNSELNTGTLTGKWYADTGEINFHLEIKSVYTYSRIQGRTTETGQTITNTIIDGTGNVVSNLQATGNADWSTDCSSSNADIVSCFSPRQASAKANGTVPWQLNFNT